ncbi:uncharacterized protein DS421_17g585070 [Arachis hypogaea]|nr:uncharacterized protein DS421_17g585070 [Arachis hypogaea]
MTSFSNPKLYLLLTQLFLIVSGLALKLVVALGSGLSHGLWSPTQSRSLALADLGTGRNRLSMSRHHLAVRPAPSLSSSLPAAEAAGSKASSSLSATLAVSFPHTTRSWSQFGESQQIPLFFPFLICCYV